MRHLGESAAHKMAVELERGKPANQRMDCISTGVQQKRVATMFLESSQDAYVKLVRTAYELALNPTLPMRQFKTLVKVQRQNGVRLVEGTL